MDWGRGPIAAQPQEASTSARYCLPASIWPASSVASEKTRSRGCVDQLYAFAGFPAQAPATPPQSVGGGGGPPPYQEGTLQEEEEYGWEAETSAAAARREEKKKQSRARQAAVKCFAAIRPSCTRPSPPTPELPRTPQETPRAGVPYGSQQYYDETAPIVVYR